MALSRRSGRGPSNIWPGFVDAVTTLLMVLMFILTIFTVVQSVLRDQISSQSTELDELSAQVAGLADALGLERAQVAQLQAGLAAAGDAAAGGRAGRGGDDDAAAGGAGAAAGGGWRGGRDARADGGE